MNLSLFEALSIAGMERIHTQTLAWLLGPHSKLASQHRLKLLEALGATCSAAELDKLTVVTEVSSLDLVAYTSSRLVLVVENKLKSRQGRNQLAIYDNAIGKLAQKLELAEAGVQKTFLTLSKEKGHTGWSDTDYGVLARALNTFPTPAYVADYAAALDRLVAARDAFVGDHRHYPEVFARVAMPTLDRLANPLPSTADPHLRFHRCKQARAHPDRDPLSTDL